MSFDLVGFGVATLDLIMEVASFPAAGGKSKILSSEYHGGGLTATALVAASKLGAKTWYGGALGNNERSDLVRKILTDFRVGLPDAGLYPTEAEPIFAHVYVDRQTGERTILWSDLGTASPVVNDETVNVALASKCLFIDNHFAKSLLPLYQLAKKRHVPIVGDFEAVTDSNDEEALSLVDHLIVPAKFAQHYTGACDPGDAVGRLLRNSGCQAAVVTDGSSGAWFADRENRQVRHQAAFHVDVIDTTGCGDVFHGAYAASLVFGDSLETRVQTAAAAAAIKATRRGGQAGAPTHQEVTAFLEKQTREL
ncbi:MAG: PfkB family carbohydrate kinase [Planctomycetaceae bacterium]|nr:PfkB family carbohydrate kinase [Planctomycetaceae bacterium]